MAPAATITLVGIDVAEGVIVGVTVFVGVIDGVILGVTVLVGVFVGVILGVTVFVGVGVGVTGVADGVGVVVGVTFGALPNVIDIDEPETNGTADVTVCCVLLVGAK